MRCIVKDCPNQGVLGSQLCIFCYKFLSTREPNNSQAYENSKIAVIPILAEIRNTIDKFIEE